MRPGVIVRLPDGSEGTTVYNGLDGVGIKWGRHHVTMADIRGSGGLFREDIPKDYPWRPDAMLREPYPGADLPCVGSGFTIVGCAEDEEADDGE